jgi:hypothetical protein
VASFPPRIGRICRTDGLTPSADGSGQCDARAAPGLYGEVAAMKIQYFVDTGSTPVAETRVPRLPTLNVER